MNEEKRMNGGYEIIESCQIGRTELVIGHNSKAPNPYVCWYCKDGSDYFWGYYCNQLSMTMDDILSMQGITVADITLINDLQKSIKSNKVISFLGGGMNE